MATDATVGLSDRDARENPLDRHFQFLAGERARDLGDDHYPVGDVPRRQLLPQSLAETALELVGPGQGRGRPGDHHKQPHLPGSAPRILHVNDQAIGDVIEALDHVVELGGADAHPAPVEGAVRTPGNDARAAVGQGGPAAVRPHLWKAFEVGGVIAAAVHVAPKANRHGGQGSREHQLTLVVDDGPSGVIEDLNGGTQATAGDLPGPHRVHGLPPTNPVHTSVPPLSEASSTSGATASYTHRAAAAGSGEPVEPSVRSFARSWPAPGRRPAFRPATR